MLYGLSGELQEWMRAIRKYEDKKQELEKSGTYDIGYYLYDEKAQVQYRETEFLISLRTELQNMGFKREAE